MRFGKAELVIRPLARGMSGDLVSCPGQLDTGENRGSGAHIGKMEAAANAVSEGKKDTNRCRPWLRNTTVAAAGLAKSMGACTA